LIARDRGIFRSDTTTALNVGQTLTPILEFNAASLLEPFGKITVLKGTKEKRRD
jgi:hypothetical protein